MILPPPVSLVATGIRGFCGSEPLVLMTAAEPPSVAPSLALGEVSAGSSDEHPASTSDALSAAATPPKMTLFFFTIPPCAPLEWRDWIRRSGSRNDAQAPHGRPREVEPE
ncbi:hypothetical protein GCM10025876_11300 [Demequina litorisediminis]|uniref:Secreted protein n=1 Tax=Demequina litorisediminis TaxID=1849022 RepID=A0ABQ6IBV3_9MICO|nr:hypothetical protein GCM10025876_11300 [Demequina litorisediminis]